VRAETRHSLKEDRFSKATIHAAENAVHWSVEHKKNLAIGIAAAVALVAIVLGGWLYFQRQDERASVELGKAVRTLDTQVRPAGMPAQPEIPSFGSTKERATEAHKQFQAIADKYPHTRSGEISRYFSGLTASDMGDNSVAERDLKDVASSSHDDMSGLAKFALASLYRKSNRDKEAIDLYKQLIDKPTATVSKVMAQLQLASLYESSQQPAEAKKIYEQIVKENPKTEAESMAQQKLQALK